MEEEINNNPRNFAKEFKMNLRKAQKNPLMRFLDQLEVEKYAPLE